MTPAASRTASASSATGEVALATKGTSWLQVPPDDLTEVDAVIKANFGCHFPKI